MRFNRLCRSCIITLSGITLGSLIYYQTEMEAVLGLDALFKIRGSRPPPDQVVVVTMDEDSDKNLDLGWDLTQWRRYHAQLIQELNRQKVGLIVFDLQFIAEQPDQDPAFAQAIRTAGNVLVTECVQTQAAARDECSKSHKDSPIQTDNANEEQLAEIVIPWKIVPPNDIIASSVLDRSPFVLPNDADNPVIRESWVFIDQLAESPTLPLTAWLHYQHLTHQLPDTFKPDTPFSEWLTLQRRMCMFDLDAAENSAHEKSSVTRQLNQLICGEDTRFLDFYGPPKSIRMESYSDVYTGKVANLETKAVFVGKANRRRLPSQKDYFQTPFTSRQSGRMAGVEIMATQFANFLENRFITPVPPLPLMAVFALCIALILAGLPGLSGLATSIVFCGLYAILAQWSFNRSGLWLPVAVPLLVQLPSSWLISLYWTYLDQKNIIKKITEENNKLIDKYIKGIQNGIPGLPDTKQVVSNLVAKQPAKKVFGICLATDIKGYTSLAEKNSPDRLFDLLRDYFDILSKVVSSQGGIIANITGDAMMAVWFDMPQTKLNRSACLATLDMEREVEKFNRYSSIGAFTTRIGLNQGDFTLGSFVRGGSETANPVGDVVNAASRIEGLNKMLGTQILASSTIAAEFDDICTRPVGAFCFVGKSEAIDLVEIVGPVEKDNPRRTAMFAAFNEGLISFQHGHWDDAIRIFEALLGQYGNDGPSKYYLETAKGFLTTPPLNWSGVIALKTK